MKRNFGFAFLLTAALAVARLPSSPSTPVEVQQRAGSVPATKPVSATPLDSHYSGGCTAFFQEPDRSKPLRDDSQAAATGVLRNFFDIGPRADPSETLKNLPGVQYAIALVPDPRHTNLSLMFDREMAVIQQAAQDEDYTYDSSWLPWRGETAASSLQDEQLASALADQREACPGLLLFRRSVSAMPSGIPYQQALVVLVVGEQPTGGLNEDQWSNALQWLARNASPKEHAPATSAQSQTQDAPRTLRVLGPAFSGTLVALDRSLGRIYHPQAGDEELRTVHEKFPSVRLLSGSVSGCTSIKWFQQRWMDRPDTPVAFGTFQENDELQIFRFLRYLRSQNLDGRDAAILSEDETAYGNQPPPDLEEGTRANAGDDWKCDFAYQDKDRPVRLFFPRDISALRNAYEKQSIFSGTSGRSEHQSHAILQEDGVQQEDGDGASDTIKAYSNHVTPLAQEALLYGIVSNLRIHHTRYLLLRCTNPLDFLFLTRFFHRAYPEGRIVTVGSDMLFRREIDSTEFRGVMALSNYPLMPREQHWSVLRGPGEKPALLHGHRVFESQTVEGMYIAGRFLFSTVAPDQPLKTPLTFALKTGIPDYADPFWLHKPQEGITHTHAPTWLTVVGRDGYWPVAVLNDQAGQPDMGQHSPPQSTMVDLTTGAAYYDLDGKHFSEDLRLKLPLAWKLCVGCALLLCFYQAFGLWRSSHATAGLFLVFRKVLAPSQLILLGINCALAVMLLLGSLSIGLTLSDLEYLSRQSWELWACLILALVASAELRLRLHKRYGRAASISFATTLVALASAAALVFEWSLKSANCVPLFYRIGHITGGVSPLLPILFLFAGFYLWTWQAMAGNALLCAGRPTLPKLEKVHPKLGRLERLHYWLLALPVEATGTGWNLMKKAQLRITRELGKRIIIIASPLSVPRQVIILPACLLLGSLICFYRDLPLLSMESFVFAVSINVVLLLACLMTAAEASRLFWTWLELRRLLAALNRLRLRRTFARLRAIDARTLWSMSGSVQRVQRLFFSQQLEAVVRLSRLPGGGRLSVLDAVKCGRKFASQTAPDLSSGPRWDKPMKRPGTNVQVSIRDVFADAVADVFLGILWPAWGKETKSLNLDTEPPSPGDSRPKRMVLPLSEDETVRAAEEFVCFHYIAYIQNILARMRTMTLSMVFLFVAVCMAISFYPFVPRTQISIWMIGNLAVIGFAVIYVYAGMERDETLNNIANTEPGQLSAEFWIKTATFLAGPLIGILTTQFPAIADSLLGWLQPGLDAISK